MKKMLLLALVLCLAVSAGAQIFYLANFNGGFPTGWAPNDARILLSNESPSTGYSPPPASGGNNVRFDDCAPQGNTVRLIFNPGISTVGRTNLRVGFGRRASNAWNNTVSLQYSTNGSSWSLISSDVTAGASQTWDNIYFDLPSGAENQANLRFRFSFTTSLSANCIAPPNFRIDDFAVGENFSLPVELTSFEAQPVPPHVRLDWTTASETENDFFAVERSADGRAFDEIGRVRGGGTTRTEQFYTFLDVRPVSGANYYRLRQVDVGGAFAYSPVRVVENPGANRILLAPSPARDVLRVKFSEPNSDMATWEIFDLAGRLLARGEIDAETRDADIPVHEFLPGTYLWRLVENRQTWTKIFQKY
jgi:hypothetical protein